ncbi:MAG: hypothetical protein NT165_00965 [Candidatus Falkowbacteria bacterium]|nr:hypothetical protein [Candidatus Falkowbacteria bacterium]
MSSLEHINQETIGQPVESGQDLIGFEQQVAGIKHDLAEKNFESSSEKIDTMEEGSIVIMQDLFGGIPTKAASYAVGSLKKLFPDKDANWLIKKAQSLAN